MMTEKYPTWLIGHVKEWAEKRLPTVILCSTTGNELLEVWYYGDLLTVKGEPQSYIIDSDEAPGLVTARDPESGEEFVIFDGGRHGYDNMFCDEHDPSELEHRPLKRYEIPASKLVLELGYSIDYEDEKENFEPDEADTVELINGERMPWEQASAGTDSRKCGRTSRIFCGMFLSVSIGVAPTCTVATVAPHAIMM